MGILLITQHFYLINVIFTIRTVSYEQLSKSGNSNLNKRFFKILGYLPLASCSINQIFFGPVDKQPIPPSSSDKKRTDGGSKWIYFSNISSWTKTKMSLRRNSERIFTDSMRCPRFVWKRRWMDAWVAVLFARVF